MAALVILRGFKDISSRGTPITLTLSFSLWCSRIVISHLEIQKVKGTCV